MGKADEVTVSTPKELGKALKDEKGVIYIEGDLTRKVGRIYYAGPMKWAVAISAIAACAIVVTAWLLSGGTGTPIAAPGVAASLAPAIAVLGYGPAVAALLIAVAGGGTGVLAVLRKEYKLITRDGQKVLVRKK